MNHTTDLNHPDLVAKRIAAVAHLLNVRIKSPALAMVKNSAYFLSGQSSHGAVRT